MSRTPSANLLSNARAGSPKRRRNQAKKVCLTIQSKCNIKSTVCEIIHQDTNMYHSCSWMLVVNKKLFYLAVQSQSGPAEESEDIAAEVPSAVTVDVEDVHPLPEVTKHVCLKGKN